MAIMCEECKCTITIYDSSCGNGCECCNPATGKELKCADLIDANMKERELQITGLLNDPNSDENSDVALSIETDKLTTVCLSYGGPADYLEILWHGHDLAWEIKRVTYRYSDWYDTATRDVPEDSPLYEYARYIIENGEI